jgi:hypothetical protein
MTVYIISDLLIIGTGSMKRELSKDTVTYLRKNNVSFEVLSTVNFVSNIIIGKQLFYVYLYYTAVLKAKLLW